MTIPQLRVARTSPALWRVAFDAPPINLIGPQLVVELRQLLDELETDPLVSVVVFESAVEDYFLAHWDIAADPALVDDLPDGPTGFHPWLDILIRLSKLPAITISSIRGRARGAGSEFVLATDIRFASREKAVLGQFEIGTGAVPGGGTPSRLPRLIGRGRALEVLVSAGDYDGELAERYGYVNRALPDDELDAFVTEFAERVARFDLRALQEVKAFVDAASLPADDEFPPQMAAFWVSASRPETQNRAGQLFARGLQQASDTELRLGAALGELEVPEQPPREAA
ncbi:enoyl-CoA hydratase/isomerase family protein [Herbiconiux daphne]|uniref:Enoyl-CoA hydratase/isomerase family protein n=1 Tax=Herbiconiux daphne TaxID=2970914 RepID=A0ABT2H599_9MICO|nr:enoyl-CoA hydratase/isomerase family protein [Herbiconiux daphne]MCS5735130.1 enoyl-CoA hydratase/isomerase family protein [Herbiconiux daphne]